MRHISPETFTDEFFGSLSERQRLLWFGILLTQADDQGRFQPNPALIRASIFPYDDINLEQIRWDLDAITKAGKLHAYQIGVNGTAKYYLQVVNWWRYQQGAQWAAPSKHPAPDGWTDRVRCHVKGSNEVQAKGWDLSGGFNACNVPTQVPTQVPTLEGTPLSSRESDIKSELESDMSQAEDESELSQAKPTPTATAAAELHQLLKANGIPRKYWKDLACSVDDFLAELARNYARGGIREPGKITALNLAEGQTAAADWYNPDKWIRYIPAEILKTVRPDLLQEDEELSEQPLASGYTNYTETPTTPNIWDDHILPQLYADKSILLPTRIDLSKCKFSSAQDGVLKVIVPDDKVQQWLASKLSSTINRLISGITGEDTSVQFEVQP